MELQEILKVIEELRSQLHQISTDKLLTDPEVLSASQMLDSVLNEYQRLTKVRENRS